ncbi:hypothetical protein CYY_010320 [Polysphondylium violaceum]|uniref:Uncharacterized protein n=1 Tax=Polysphondylium violaceum TaxID=133409 RepID=A0A8J4UV71_9MYCE|nr:hypothetical protein CYY_010320 [Polysphondylium violaceum]
MNIFKSTIFLIFLLFMVQPAWMKSLNISHVDYYTLYTYEKPDCTGEVISFYNFYEHQLYSFFFGHTFYCDQSTRSCRVETTTGISILQVLNDTYVIDQCKDGMLLKYKDDLDYYESDYCITGEYSTPVCDYRPILYHGIIRGKCYFGKYTDCSLKSYSSFECTPDGQKGEEIFEKPTFLCGCMSIVQRSLSFQPWTKRGVIDSNIERVRNLVSKQSFLDDGYEDCK